MSRDEEKVRRLVEDRFYEHLFLGEPLVLLVIVEGEYVRRDSRTVSNEQLRHTLEYEAAHVDEFCWGREVPYLASEGGPLERMCHSSYAAAVALLEALLDYRAVAGKLALL